VEAGRCPEQVAFIQSKYVGANDRLRGALLNDWALCTTVLSGSPASLRDRLDLYQEAIKLNPDVWDAYASEQLVLESLGNEEDAWRVGEAFRRSAGARLAQLPGGEVFLFPWDALTKDLQAERDALTDDVAVNGLGGSSVHGSSTPNIAEAEVGLHDPTAAELTYQTVQAGDQLPSGVTAIHAIQHLRGLVDEERGNLPQAALEMEAAWGLIPANPVVPVTPGDAGRICQAAPIEDAVGHPGLADAVLRAGGPHSVDCLRFRGDILDHRGDWAGAQQAYAQAVALAPDLPAGYYSWGVALERHGDLAGAIAKLQAANQRGPHWADPLKAWGDVLVKQGHWGDAVAKYDEALKYAPNWAALQQARDAAASKRG
jgi:tetratricopeptide (TPR) repeat protein